MKNKIIYFSLIFVFSVQIIFLLSGCIFSSSNSEISYTNLLSKEEGKYAILSQGIELDPEYLRDKYRNIDYIYFVEGVDVTGKNYPELKADKPTIFVFDRDDIVLKTNDINELYDFFDKKNNLE